MFRRIAAVAAVASTVSSFDVASGTTMAAAAATSNSAVIDDATINLTGDADDWWANAIEEDLFNSPLPFDASEGGLWNGKFVPPPPRPPFLDDSVSSDGLTTCDLCSWAWHERNAFSLDGSIETADEIGWALTLIIVSVISALIGAIIMVIVLRCRRMKSSNASGGRQLPWWCRSGRANQTSGRHAAPTKHPADTIRGPHSNSGVWTWLGARRASAGPDQLGPPPSSPAENHYTHMDDAYSPVGVGEALYAELDRESVRSANPSYQNTAYSGCGEVDNDVPIVSSAPSSAYYSDLSVTAMPNERAYEVVGMTLMSTSLPQWSQTPSAPAAAVATAGAMTTLDTIAATAAVGGCSSACSSGSLLEGTVTCASTGNLISTSSLMNDATVPSPQLQQQQQQLHLNGGTTLLACRRPTRLSSINETTTMAATTATTVPSDYV